MTENVLGGIQETVSPTPVRIVGEPSPKLIKLAERLKLANAAAAAAKKEQELAKEGILLEIAAIDNTVSPECAPIGTMINFPNALLFEVGQQIRLDQSALKTEEPETFERFSGPTRVLKFKPLV